MLHSSRAKKNKHQKHFETRPGLYLYTDHDIPTHLSQRLTSDLRAELEDDIFYMRRQFKRNVKKLSRNVHYTNWLVDNPYPDSLQDKVKLRSRYV